MILTKARELGVALSESSEFLRMNATREALDNDTQANGLLQRYRERQEELMELLQTDSPDKLTIGDLSNDVENLQELLLGNSFFSEAMEAQNTFEHLMRHVNKEIAACIGMQQEEEEGCGGSCGGCSGCQH